MENSTNSSKKIAKNTILLYVRMLFLMLISLYTSRVILSTLGVEDYGIYNVVGGFVTMFSLLSSSLSSAISRFITFEIGTQNFEKIKDIFSSSITIQFGLSGIIFLLGEAIGFWFINNYLSIPSDRLEAAQWIFQFSLLTFIVNLISVPYNALIIAHERMSVFAYISIIEGINKLLIAYLILVSPIDNLVFYGLLMLINAIIIRFLYTCYCKRNFKESAFKFKWDPQLLKEMFSFAGWTFWGTGSHLLMTQGVNILINMFFGVTLNAARAIAIQVENSVQQFINSFTTSINPQITKSYANNNHQYMLKLIFVSSKISFFLLWLIALPILLETEYILDLWLKDYPEYTITFTKLTIYISLISVISNPLVTAMLATGKIKKYQLIVGGLGMCIFPISYVFYKLGFSVEYAYYTHIVVFCLQFLSRLILLRDMINMPIKMFLQQVVSRLCIVVVLSIIIPGIFVSHFDPSLERFIGISLVSAICNLSIIYAIGLTPSERTYLMSYIKRKKQHGNR